MPGSLAAKSLKDDSSLALRERQPAVDRMAQTGSPNQLLELQQNIGNRAVGDLLQCGGDVTKLTSANLNLSNPEDPSERDARQTAAGLLSLAPSGIGDDTRSLSDSQSLSESARAHFEPRLGVDLSRVRLHTGSRAASSARALNAKAFTLGSDIVFGAGHYAPDTPAGQRVLAHELSHVAQQARGSASANTIYKDDEPPRPDFPAFKSQKFTDLPEGTPISDPTGGTHGITIIRRGEDLFYQLPAPNKVERKVPRPLDVKTNKRQAIKDVDWGGGGIGQTAFNVVFEGFDTPYSVNKFGLGTMQSLVDALFQRPAALQVDPEGLERERKPGTLLQARPKDATFKSALRYHIPGAEFSMYVFSNRSVQVVEDKTGKKLWGPITKTGLKDVQISQNGDVFVSFDDVGHTTKGDFGVKFNLRGPTFSPTGLGQLAVSEKRKAFLDELKALKVKVVEKGSQFNEIELEAAVDILKRWQGKKGVVDSLKANGVPGLTMIKDVLMDTGGSFDDDTGIVKIPGGVRTTPAEERNVVIHELSHALFTAKGLTSPKKGKVPEHIKTRAAELLDDSDVDFIEEGAVSGIRVRKKRTQKEWEKDLSTNEKLNEIWQELHHRFLISDPEGTSDIRGLDVADESRYLGGNRGDVLGHGFDSVNEFVASFIASSLRFQPEMTETIKNSEDLLLLYRQLWTIVNSNIANLGAQNPYQ